MSKYEVLISIFTGLVTAIPLVIKLVEYVKKAIMEKNWANLLSLIMNLMAEAESKFEKGADKKAWVISMIEASARTINYDVDIQQVAELIDSLCTMSKLVNAPVETENVGE